MSTTPWPHHDKVEEHPKAETGNSTGSETPAKTWTGAFGHACGVLLQAIVNGLALTKISPNVLTFIGLLINTAAAVLFGFANDPQLRPYVLLCGIGHHRCRNIRH